MKESDQLATLFSLIDSYCFITMPFELKNTRATYQQCMQLCLHTQISRNVEAYVDDIIIKSRKAKELIRGLSNTSDNL